MLDWAREHIGTTSSRKEHARQRCRAGETQGIESIRAARRRKGSTFQVFLALLRMNPVGVLKLAIRSRCTHGIGYRTERNAGVNRGPTLGLRFD